MRSSSEDPMSILQEPNEESINSQMSKLTPDPMEFMNKWRQNRACARCRRLKMKCAYENPNSTSCKRCLKTDVECSPDNDPTAKFARKHRKPGSNIIESISPGITSEAIVGSNNGDQISQLQKLMKLVSTSLNSLEHDFAVTPSVSSSDKARLKSLGLEMKQVSNKLTNMMKVSKSNNLKQFQNFHKSPSLQDWPYIPFDSNIVEEITKKHKLVSLQEYKIRHQFFLDEMLPYYPIIAFSKQLEDFDYLYENDPLLLTGCVYVTTINDNGLSSQIQEKYYKLSNAALNQMLNYYLESFISYHVYIKSNDFSFRLVELCLMLSLWCLPTTTSGHFKNQFHLLIGFNISLCIDLGDISKNLMSKMSSSIPVLADVADQRNNLRAFLSVYVSCGSLGLSLPRFKLVNWSKQHALAIELLMKEGEVDGVMLPSRNDRYLCQLSKVIRLGQEIFDYFSPSLLIETNSANRRKDAFFQNMLDPRSSSLPHIKFVLDNYEQKLYTLMIESGFMDSPEPDSGKNQPKEKYLLSVIYYQLLMIVYDGLVSRYFFVDSKPQSQNSDPLESLSSIQYVVKLIQLCENLLKSFIILGQQRTINVPTFFFYRPMHSLILLIKLRLLIRSLNLASASKFINPDDLKINAEVYFEGIQKLIHEGQHNHSSIVCLRMAIILSRIEKWILLSNGKPQLATSAAHAAKDSSTLAHMIDTSKEIENLRAPKDEDEPEPQPYQHNNSVGQPSLNQPQNYYEPTDNIPTPTNGININSNSIQEIFQTIDSDILHYLNPLDANIDFDINFPSFEAPNFNPPMGEHEFLDLSKDNGLW